MDKTAAIIANICNSTRDATMLPILHRQTWR